MFMGMEKNGARQKGLGDELSVIASPLDMILPEAQVYEATDATALVPETVAPLNLDTSGNYTQQTVAPGTVGGSVATVGVGTPAGGSSSLWSSLTTGILSLIGKTIPSTTIKTTSPSGATSTYSTSTGQMTSAPLGSSITGLGTTVGISSSTILLLGLGLVGVMLLSKQSRAQ